MADLPSASTAQERAALPRDIAVFLPLLGIGLHKCTVYPPGHPLLKSAFDALAPYRVPISLFFIALVAWGNLRGVRESGRIFAIPTYFFMVTMALLQGEYGEGDTIRVDAAGEGLTFQKA